MNLREFLTYSFAPNVGTPGRIFRILSGLLIAVSPWIFFSVPLWLSSLLTAFGVAWTMTGILSRCGMYYLLGKSTRPHADQAKGAAS